MLTIKETKITFVLRAVLYVTSILRLGISNPLLYLSKRVLLPYLSNNKIL